MTGSTLRSLRFWVAESPDARVFEAFEVELQ